MRSFAIILACLIFSAPLSAQEAEPGVPTVVVPGERVVLWSYRTLAAGLKAFERDREMAPAAQLRFKFRLNEGRTDLSGVSLTLVGDGWEQPLAIGADGKFVLNQDGRAERDDAQLFVAGRRELFDPKNSPRVEVRTPGLPENVIRMGDARLECQVNQAIAKKHMGLMMALTLNAIGGFDWCNPRKQNGTYAITPARPFTRAVVVEGERRVTIHDGALKTSKGAPVHDVSWSHDALIEFSAPQ